MANELTNLELEEVSLVGTGDDPEARVTFWKKAKENTHKMTDDMKAKLKPYTDKGYTEEEAMKAYEEDMKKELEKSRQETQRLTKFLLDQGFVIKQDTIEKKEPEETVEVNGEQVTKSAIPAPVLKALEQAEFEKAESALKERVQKEAPNLDESVAKTLLKTADQTKDEKFMEFIRSVDQMFAKNFEEVGKDSQEVDMNDPAEKLDKMAKEHATKEGVSVEKAYDLILGTEDGRKLYDAMDEEK